MGNNLLKFADDTKLFSRIASSKDADVLQRDFNSMHRWSVEWLMLFNAEKCKCVHYGHNNKHNSFKGHIDILIRQRIIRAST